MVWRYRCKLGISSIIRDKFFDLLVCYEFRSAHDYSEGNQSDSTVLRPLPVLVAVTASASGNPAMGLHKRP